MVCYEVKYALRGDRSELLDVGSIGFFKNKKEIIEKLKGLCPWDFNSMWGDGRFVFVEHPFSLTNHDTKRRDKIIEEARKHARENKDLWNRRWNGEFPSEEEER